MIKDVEWMTDILKSQFYRWLKYPYGDLPLHTATQKFGLRYKCCVLVFYQNEVSTQNNSNCNSTQGINKVFVIPFYPQQN